MRKSLEEIVGKVERERILAGTREGEEETVRYVSFDLAQSPSNLFEQVVWAVDPPIARHGGVVLDPGIVITPDGTAFYPLIINGDVAGWQVQIEQGAKTIGALTAKIKEKNFVVSNGQSFLLAECSIQR